MSYKKFKKIHVIVLDSLGIGETPDAGKFGDTGADTLGGITRVCKNIQIPNLHKLGIASIRPLPNLPSHARTTGYYGKAGELSNGKDTMTGHWELMGVVTQKPFTTFPEGFPEELIQRIENHCGRKIIGNCVASGTEIIEILGEEQIKTGAVIIYTSVDSVMQIAAHEDIIPLEELYGICEFCRRITLDEPYKIGRVIARPFKGKPGSFARTPNRHDYALKPPAPTVLDALKDNGLEVLSIGKIADIFDMQGITKAVRTVSNNDGMEKLTKLAYNDFTGLSFTNLVDFDSIYGHRRNPEGYAKALEEFDTQLGILIEQLTKEELLIITADHGTDPTFKGTDHTREYVPVLAYSKIFNRSGSLGTRNSFADVGATVADNFKANIPDCGESFLEQLV